MNSTQGVQMSAPKTDWLYSMINIDIIAGGCLVFDAYKN